MKQKLSEKTWFIWLRITVVWLSYIPLGLFITGSGFSLDFYYKVLPLGGEVRKYWFTENFYNMLVYGIIAVVILFLFRYKFKKTENFQINANTLITGIVCLVISVAAVIYSDFVSPRLWQAYAGEIIKLLIAVSLFEELIFRGFITNEMFRLREKGIKLPAGIAVSSVIFGLMHLPAYFLYNTADVGGAVFRFLFPTVIGASYAIILYYKKDILSLIFIHTASNICGGIAGQPFDIVFFALMCVYTAALVWKNAKNKKGVKNEN